MTWDKVMKLRNRIRIFAVIFILALGMEYLPMAVYAAEVTASPSAKLPRKPSRLLRHTP